MPLAYDAALAQWRQAAQLSNAAVFMPLHSEADVLEIKRRTAGDLIAVGLPWDSVIFVQEYWAGAIPYYAIANVSHNEATITVAEWSGAVGRCLIGPWTIAPKSVQHYDIQSIQANYSGPLVAISLNENPVHGLLQSPKSSSEFADADKHDGILTTYGLNGVGDRSANLSCLQERLVLDSGQVIRLMFKVPDGTRNISFGSSSRSDRLPQTVVTTATSKTLSVETEGTSFRLGAREITKAAFHEIGLEVELPEVESEMMAALWGHVASPSGGGFYFARGLIVSCGVRGD